MFSSLLPVALHKNWLLHLCAFLTWLVVSFLSLSNPEYSLEYAIKVLAFSGFYLLFFWVTASKNANNKLLTKTLVIIQLAVIFYLIVQSHTVAAILLVLIATQLPSMLTRKQAILWMLLITLVHFLLLYDGAFFDTFFHVLIFLMLQFFGFSSIETIQREAQAKEELAVVNQELVATRYMLKASSERQERMRISRDLHDIVGHQLTALILNLEVASHKVPRQFKSLLQDNQQLAKTLLADVRDVVKDMRAQAQFDLETTLQNLVKQLPSCTLTIQAPLNINSLHLKQQLMLCLQEGITNALRHGKADQLTLTFIKKDDEISMTLVDNGVNRQNPKAIVFGSGLTGMQERLAIFSGTVQLANTAAGYILKLTVKDCYD